MTEQEAGAFAARLTRIWMPDGSFGQGAVWQFREGKLEYTAQITDELQMDFGPSFVGDGVGFHLRRIQNGRTTGSLYCALNGNGSQVQSATPTSEESEQEFVRFAELYGPLMRTYCWLSGCSLQCNAGEKEIWTDWLREREQSGHGDPTNTVEWEVQRVATAFGVEAVSVVRRITGVQYEGVCGDLPITWALGDPNARVKNIYVGDRSYCGVYFSGGKWEWEPGQEGHEELAQGIYRLGIEDEHIWTQLPPLSAHEKLELRLTLPREFWPKNWLRENGM